MTTEITIPSNCELFQDPVVLKNTSGTCVNPATEDKQDDMITELQDLDLNTDGLEISQLTQEEVMLEILRELKHLNLQMSFITDTTLSDEDKIDN